MRRTTVACIALCIAAPALLSACSGDSSTEEPSPPASQEAPSADDRGTAWVPFVTTVRDSQDAAFANAERRTIAAGSALEGVMAVDAEQVARDTIVVTTKDGVAQLPIDATRLRTESTRRWERVRATGHALDRDGGVHDVDGHYDAWVTYDARQRPLVAQARAGGRKGWLMLDGHDIAVLGPVKDSPPAVIRSGWLPGTSATILQSLAESLAGEGTWIDPGTSLDVFVPMAEAWDRVPVLFDGKLQRLPAEALELTTTVPEKGSIDVPRDMPGFGADGSATVPGRSYDTAWRFSGVHGEAPAFVACLDGVTCRNWVLFSERMPA
jgi:hypothetical protein